jgi:protocatechuate 3,4-dioxygenase, beta subunit
MSPVRTSLAERMFMSTKLIFPNRRLFLGAFGTALYTSPGLFADLLKTPAMTEGPFYPDRLPLDQDNDLILINKNITPAIGEITHLTGKVIDVAGNPIKDALIEIWQCDAKAVYLHSSDSDRKKEQQDKNFQGYGKFTTNAKGEYRFRTIKPVPYPGRPAPHIHFKVRRGDRTLITSQFMIRGHDGNTRDGVLNRGADAIDRELLLADFTPIKESKIGEWNCDYTIVVGKTPDETPRDKR